MKTNHLTLPVCLRCFLKSTLPKKFFLSIIVYFLFANICLAGTYYSNSANPATVNNWWTNTNGTGTHPANFTTSGDIFILQSGQTCATAADWTIGSGVTLQVDGILSINGNNDDVIVTGTITFTSANATQITMTGGGAGNTITINGTIKTANTNGLQGTNCSLPTNAAKKTVIYGAAATYEFNGGSAQATTGLPASVTNLNMNNSNSITINSSLTITGTLTLTNGIMIIPTGITVNITSGNAIAGSGFGNTKHINTQVNNGTGAQGFIRVGNISAAYTLPTGNGTYYLPVTLTPSATNDFSVNVFQGATQNGAPNGTAMTNGIKQRIVDAIWIVNRNSGTGNATMQLSWPNALEGSSFTTLGNGSIGISHFSGGIWDLASGSGDQALNLATRNGLSSFSPFLASEIGIALPMKFGNVKLSSQNTGLQVDWTSLAELNVDHYEIERSTDGQQFISIGQVKATGNNSAEKNYSWLDVTPINGISFYRIKAVDADGKFNYSNTIKINPDPSNKAAIAIYPNPVQGNHIAIETGNMNAGNYQYLIFDINGRKVYSHSFRHPGGVLSESILLPADLGRGIYNLKLNGQNFSLIKTFAVQ